MNSSRVTAILFAAATVIAVAVPGVRDGIVLRYESLTAHEFSFEELVGAAERGDDPGLWLAVAEVGRARLDAKEWGGSDHGLPEGYAPDRAELEQVYRRAVRADPANPALRLWEVKFLAYPVGLLLEWEDPETPNSEQHAVLGLMRERLQEIEELDPANAVPRMLIAWTWLAEADLDRAVTTVLKARDAEYMTSYVAEAAGAVMALNRRLEASPPEKLRYEVRWSWGPKLTDLDTAFKEAAEKARLSGEHDRALRLYEALIHMSRLRHADPWDFEDIEWGRKHLEVESLGREELAAYLVGQGREDLTGLYREQLERADFFQQRLARQPLQEPGADEGFELKDVPGMLLTPIWVTGILMIVAAVFIGLVSVMNLYWRDDPRPVHPSEWVVMFAVLLVPPAFAILWLLQADPRMQDDGAVLPVLILPLLDVIAWMAIAWYQAKPRVPEPDEEGYPGHGRVWLGYMRRLLGPTLGVLILLMLPRLYGQAADYREAERHWVRTSLQGPVADAGIAGTEQKFVERTRKLYGKPPLTKVQVEESDGDW